MRWESKRYAFPAPGALMALALGALVAAGCGGTPPTITPDAALTQEKLMVSAIAYDDLKGEAPYTQTFYATVHGGQPPYTYTWDFGDGSPQEGDVEVSHTFEHPGRYEVIITVTDGGGKTGYDCVILEVSGTMDPLAVTLVAEPLRGLLPLEVQLQASASGGGQPYIYSWTFGDGGTHDPEPSTGCGNKDFGASEISHVFADEGVYVVEVMVTDGFGITAVGQASVEVMADVPCSLSAIVAEPQGGIVPLEVLFSVELEQGNEPVAYAWTFGDGGVSDERLPYHTYTEGGTYQVSVTATDFNGDTDTATMEITVEEDTEPVVAISVDREAGLVGESFFFEAAIEGGNLPFDYEWAYGDGIRSYGEAPAHTYIEAGTYTVTLTLTDADGDVGTDSVTVVVGEDQEVEVAVGLSPTTGLVPLTVHLQALVASGNAPYLYLWQLGEGTTSSLPELDHTYRVAGTYTIDLTVVDADGDSADAQATVEVQNSTAPTATILAEPDEGTAPLRVAFTGDVVGGNEPYTFAWDFGDGGKATMQNPSHIFEEPASYTVTFKVTDLDGDMDEATLVILASADDRPVARIVAASPLVAGAPFDVTFVGEAEGGNAPLTYTWDFGDGQGGEGANVTHTYEVEGTYRALLTVTDVDGDRNTASVQIEAQPNSQPVVDSITPDPAEPPEGSSVTFTAQVTGGNGELTYLWDLGDGITTSELSPVRDFPLPGTYPISLSVTDADGEVGEGTMDLEVHADLFPVAHAAADPVTGGAPLRVTFTGTTEGGDLPLSSYIWDFGDGSTGRGTTATHTYEATGTYTVVLTVTDLDGDESTDSVVIIVAENDTPTAEAAAHPLFGAVPLAVTFTGGALGGNPPISYLWDFGDGVTSPDAMTEHTYEAVGSYTVVLLVTDADGDTDNASVTIEAQADVEPVASAEADVLVGVAPLDVTLTGSATGGNPPYTVLWNFGDGEPAVADSMEVTHTYQAEGTYNALFTVTDADGDEDIATVTIHVDPDLEPSLTFTATPSSGPWPLEVTFAATVTDGNPPFSFLWDFRDGTTSQEPSPVVHTFEAPGDYEVSAIVTDADGDTDAYMVLVTVTEP